MSPTRRMRIGFLLGRSFTDTSTISAAIRLLTEWGATVESLHLGDDLNDVARVRLDYDLYVLKNRGDLAMSLAADLHRAGAALLNPYPVSATLRDRTVTFRVLQAAGVSTPETFVASHVSQLLPALDRGPVVLKPPLRSSMGTIEVVSNPAELAAFAGLEEPVYAERYLRPQGPVQKIYSIGSELFGVAGDNHRGASTTESAADVARRCGAAFGIDLFSVDIVESDGRLWVVDMSSFPGFKSVPEAGLRLAKYVYAAAECAARGEPVVPAEWLGERPGASDRAFRGSKLELVLRSLSLTPTTPQELDQIETLVDEIRIRARAPRHATLPDGGMPSPRVALYSQGMVGFGHVRRNASIAHALRSSALEPAIVMIAEAWQAGALLMPPGVDCVTLPALRREADGGYSPRFLLDLSDREVIALRTRVIQSAMEAFEPDLLIVDYLPLGVASELTSLLRRARKRGTTRCVLGLREVLYDRATVQRTWATHANLDAIRDYYDAVWIYGDPVVFDPVREYGLSDHLAAKARYTGYLDQRPRLEWANRQPPPFPAHLLSRKLALCLVGGGHDGAALADAFLRTDLPSDTTGVLITGPLMPWDQRQHIRRSLRQGSHFVVLDFVPDPAPLIERADRVIAMGGYNTVCEILSFEKHGLIVPRVHPEPEQFIRAKRLKELGLIEVLHPDELTPRAVSEWLARDLGPPPPSRSRIDLGGLSRIPRLVAELLGVPVEADPAGRTSVSMIA